MGLHNQPDRIVRRSCHLGPLALDPFPPAEPVGQPHWQATTIICLLVGVSPPYNLIIPLRAPQSWGHGQGADRLNVSLAYGQTIWRIIRKHFENHYQTEETTRHRIPQLHRTIVQDFRHRWQYPFSPLVSFFQFFRLARGEHLPGDHG